MLTNILKPLRTPRILRNLTAIGVFLGLDSDHDWRTFLFRWLSFSLILHMIASVFSLGHHSADEYFQILEFVSYQLGKTPAHHLPTEFREQMRPWMQPGIYYCMTKFWELLGVENPFTWAMSFRALTGVIGWISSVGMALCSRFWFSDLRARKFAVLTLALVWFFPALHVRPSSENLAGSVFLIALSLAYLLWNYRWDSRPSASKSVIQNTLWFIVGALLGLSFECRFQLGFMTVGMVAWLFYYGYLAKRIPLQSLLSLSSGILVLFALGRWVDHWGYGQWVLSPYNYLSFNLIRGEVSKYGTAPWWDIFRMAMTETWPVLGFLIAICTVIAWVRHPRHILTWSQIPFFIVHEMIGHKEGRFFFPIALAAPILLTLCFYSERTQLFITLQGSKPFQKVTRWAWNFLVVNNIIALVALLFTPFARTAQFYEGVYNSIPPGTKKFEIFTLHHNPYILLGNPVFFYRPSQLVVTKINSYEELKKIITTRNEPLWFFDTHFHLSEDASPIVPYCRSIYQIYPPSIEKINFGNWLERTLTWTLYQCGQTQHSTEGENQNR